MKSTKDDFVEKRCEIPTVFWVAFWGSSWACFLLSYPLVAAYLELSYSGVAKTLFVGFAFAGMRWVYADVIWVLFVPALRWFSLRSSGGPFSREGICKSSAVVSAGAFLGLLDFIGVAAGVGLGEFVVSRIVAEMAFKLSIWGGLVLVVPFFFDLWLLRRIDKGLSVPLEKSADSA